MVGTKWGASHHEHVQVSKRLCERTETDDAGCCVERHPCRMETCGTEEPDEGNLHVRICGGGWPRNRWLYLDGTRRASLAMMFKLAQSASKKWRRLNCHEKISLVIEGRSFKDGIIQKEIAA
jgi:hypothetical protein